MSRRRYPTSLWRRHIVAMETSDDVAKTTSLQRLIITSLHETLQRRRFCNVIRRFHRNYMATSEWRWIATSQQRCNDVFVSAGYLLSRGIFCIFFLFYNSESIFILAESKDYRVLCNMGYRKGASFLLSSLVLLCCLNSYCFELFLWDFYSSCLLIFVSLEMHFFSLGLICNKCQCLSMFVKRWCFWADLS